MNGQSRTFVKQVQQDLLALSDADLYRTIHQWVDGKNISGQYPAVAEDTLCALGYIRVAAETSLSIDEPGATDEMPVIWQPPSPATLRTLLTDMDVNLFAQHVIALAYRSLHSVYPEWYEGLTFNAHLANYLRQIRVSWHPRPVDITTTRNPYPGR
ncbi:MAG: hypothetical protein ACRDIV_09380 [Ktedonobacteraceae bacterium]